LVDSLLDEGWRVEGADLQSEEPGPGTRTGGRYTHHRVDLADTMACDAFAAAMADRGITAFVHCAGIMRTGGVVDTDMDEAQYLWRLHVAAPIAILKTVGAGLPDRAGRVVLVSSRAVLGRAGRAAYASSKAAQLGLIRSWAAELIGRGVTVNAVAPGAVDTPMLRDPQRGAPPVSALPLGRLVRPQEVAATIAFFLGDEAGAITGQTLYVCGGASLGAAPM
jgi:NAD(P)-dependent dehydrogenase (short-subunit alcohol dehydrogenase family)